MYDPATLTASLWRDPTVTYYVSLREARASIGASS